MWTASGCASDTFLHMVNPGEGLSQNRFVPHWDTPTAESNPSDQDEIYEQVALLSGHTARGINWHSAAAARLSKELTYSLLQEDIKAMVPSAASLL